MLSLFLAAIPVLTSSASIANADPEQSVRMSNNGEFIARNYPLRALKAREEGKVGFRLVVESDGSLGSCDVTSSSGSKALDNETCELILRHARLNPVRNADGRAVRAVQNGYINWKLPANAPQMASAAASHGPDPDRIICKRSAKTGSLIARTKQCMTARQWAEASRIARGETQKLIGSGHVSEEGMKAACTSTMQNPAGC
jgi:periplasmic protein TonB